MAFSFLGRRDFWMLRSFHLDAQSKRRGGENVMSGVLLGLLFLIVTVPAGMRVLKLLPLTFAQEEKFLFGSGTGLILVVMMIVGLGLLGHLTSVWVGAGMVAVAFYGMHHTRSAFRFRSDKTFLKQPFLTLCIAAAALTMMAVLSGIIAPETANDSLCYHLHVPKIFLAHQTIFKVPYEINSLFPFFMEMLDTIGIAWKQIALAKFIHAFTAVGAGIAVYALGKKTSSAQAGLLCALLFVTTPGIANQMGTTYVDISLAFFTMLSLFAYLRHYETQRLSWALLSGLMMGAAMSIKFLALLGGVLIGALMLLDGIFAKRKKVIPALALFAAGTLAVCAYWYLRSWIEWGNPVYPYFYQVFKSGYIKDYTDIGVPRTLPHFLMLPWTMTMKPQLFEGFGDNIGPFYLAFLPLGGSALIKNKILKRVAVFSFFYLVLWFVLGQSLRFFFPALPALAVLCAAGLGRVENFKSDWAKNALFAIVLGTLMLHAALAVYHYRSTLQVAVGAKSPEDYLRKTERSYKMAEFVNKNLPANAKILNAVEVRMYYFEREIVREDVYTDFTHYDEKGGSPAAALEALKKDGFTHFLLVTEPHSDFSRMGPNRLPRVIAGEEKTLAHWGPPLYTYTFTDGDNPPVHYSLYQL